MKLRFLLLFCVLVVVLAKPLFLGAENANSETSATVVGIVGQWCQIDPPLPHDKNQLHFGMDLKFDRSATLTLDCDEGTLTLRIGDVVTAFHCPASGRLPIQKSDVRNGKFSSVLAFAGPLIEYVFPVSRGLEPELNDAVVPISGDRVDLRGAFQGMDSGNYRVRLESVSRGKATDPALVAWSEGSSASLSIPGLAPGLYKLGQLDAKGQLAAPEAWVLLTRPEDFEKARSTYQEALEATKKWPAEVDARAPRAFLRQVLDGLSRQPGSVNRK